MYKREDHVISNGVISNGVSSKDLISKGLISTGTPGAETTTAEGAHRGKAGHRKPARNRIDSSRTVRERVVWPARWQRRYETAAGCCDLLCIVLALVVVALGYHTWPQVADHRTGAVVAAVPLVVMSALAAQRAWDPRVLGAGTGEYRRVVRAYLFALALMSIAGYAWGTAEGQSWVFGALPIGLGLTLVVRRILRHAVAVFRRTGRCVHSVLVAGDAEEVHEIISRAQDLLKLGWRVDGVCLSSAGRADALPSLVDGVRVLGTHDDIVALTQRHRFDAVALLPSGRWTHTRTRRLSWDLEEIGSELLIAPVLMDVVGPRLHIAPMAGLPLLRMSAPRYSGPAWVVKNILDRVAALAIVVVLAPVLLAVALAVRIDCPGPVLYRQTRVGRDGARFTMYKFRSMVPGADQRLHDVLELDAGAGVLFKAHDDPRITRVGRVIRRYSLDELPQLLNVVRGDMSLVGPRPPLESEVARYGEDGAHRRLFVKPGLTGLWQVSGRSDLSWEESVRADLRYVENWSFTMDLSILRRTVGAVLRRDGAY
ncbi:sugar transferase [Rhodococcus sp. (in: high G+C Gram-positive bacteria)]|uniref:sugar transferase n=1 Tax=Rhodococcus sp. TaxID=1831 RepID=UPI00388E284B